MATKRDVVVLGAGAAGLAAGAALRQAGADVLVLEARQRIGGRVHTRFDPRAPVPIELGAEFVHGPAEELRPLFARGGLRVVDVAGQHWRADGDGLRCLDDFWARLHRVFRRFDDVDERDRSAEMVLSHGDGVDAEDRHLARQFVEGFQAADPARASARALAGDGNPSGDAEARRMGRVVDGYAGALEVLAEPLRGRIHCSSVVTRVRWRRGQVDVDVTAPDGRSLPRVSASAAVVAVPLAVLQAPLRERGSIHFDPGLDRKRLALLHLAPGQVVRVVLAFARPVWLDDDVVRRAGGRPLDRLAFLHGDDLALPVWWTPYPLRVPMLVGWCGGPAAAQLARQPHRAWLEAALGSLATALGVPVARLRTALRGAWSYDWMADPFARGAYSYQLVGGEHAPEDLAAPLDGTLFFAGEATTGKGRIGTVDGAVASGMRAARQVEERRR